MDAKDPSRSVIARHFRTHLSKDMHQCGDYDSDKPGARLIGETARVSAVCHPKPMCRIHVQYVITEAKFVNLPVEEKKVVTSLLPSTESVARFD